MLENLEPRRVFYFFEEMNKIPRDSGDEKAISDWVYNWAQNLGLSVVQDEWLNLVIKKPGSAGYEKAEPVIIQAHLDMVCEKTPESTHDFTKDPISLKVEGDFILSACGTSLGADDGIGVAYAMAVLEDDSLKHPPLEVIFTVEEESTFSGAANISPKLYDSKRMINIDHAVDNQVLAGSCGGTGVNFTADLLWEDCICKDSTYYKVCVDGLKGGHSGEDIHRGRGNAIEILIRLLRDEDIRICSLKGGTYRLAIPREAEAVIRVAEGKTEAAKDRIKAMTAIFKKEYAGAAPNFNISLESCEPMKALTKADNNKVLQIVDLYPNGILKMNGTIPGVVESSDNLGTIEVSDGKLFITSEIRGAYTSTVEDIKDKVESLKCLVGGETEYFGGYVPWEYNPDSNLRIAAQKAYGEIFEDELESVVVHAGIECGMFTEKSPEMDAISIGPNCEFFHSPNERMSIKSAQKTYKFLTGLLESLDK